MLVHFGMERFMFDTRGAALSITSDEDLRDGEDFEDGIYWLVVTLPGGDDVPVLAGTSPFIDSIMTNIAMAAITGSPYILFDSAEGAVQIAPASPDYEGEE